MIRQVERRLDDLEMIQILSGTNEHTFYTYDANYNVTAALDRDGNVVERYTYTPYGQRTVIDDDWSSDGDGLSDISSNFGHQGGVIDVESGLMKFRHRDYHVSLGNWAERDPLDFADGMNLYQAYSSNPLINIDPLGLFDIGFQIGFDIAPGTGRYDVARQYRIFASVQRIYDRLVVIDRQYRQAMMHMSACVSRIVGPEVAEFGKRIVDMQIGILGKEKWWIKLADLVGEPELAYTSRDARLWYMDAYTVLNNQSRNGTQSWFQMSDSELDTLLFHEIGHLVEGRTNHDGSLKLYDLNIMDDLMTIDLEGSGSWTMLMINAKKACNEWCGDDKNDRSDRLVYPDPDPKW